MIYSERDPTYKDLLTQEALKQRGLYTGELDNWWGPKSESAYRTFILEMNAVVYGVASTFADPMDIARFETCKATGKPDSLCFLVGDNGIGFWGDDTTTTDKALCAFGRSTLAERFGGFDDEWKTKAKHAPVRVTYKNKTVDCIVADVGAPEGRIDLNPGACDKLGIKPGDLVSAFWEWLA
jgi:hypothetical protein